MRRTDVIMPGLAWKELESERELYMVLISERVVPCIQMEKEDQEQE